MVIYIRLIRSKKKCNLNVEEAQFQKSWLPTSRSLFSFILFKIKNKARFSPHSKINTKIYCTGSGSDGDNFPVWFCGLGLWLESVGNTRAFWLLLSRSCAHDTFKKNPQTLTEAFRLMTQNILWYLKTTSMLL